jgi:hypothetical protein
MPTFKDSNQAVVSQLSIFSSSSSVNDYVKGADLYVDDVAWSVTFVDEANDTVYVARRPDNDIPPHVRQAADQAQQGV